MPFAFNYSQNARQINPPPQHTQKNCKEDAIPDYLQRFLEVPYTQEYLRSHYIELDRCGMMIGETLQLSHERGKNKHNMPIHFIDIK